MPDQKPLIVHIDSTESPLELERKALAGIDCEIVSVAVASEGEIMEAAKDATVILNNHSPVTEAMVDQLPNCKLIIRYGHGYDTVDANVHLGFAPDIRHYGVGAHILKDLGVGKMRILTNNPRKLAGLDGFGELKVVEQVPIKARPNKENSKYLETKRKRLGHLLEEADTVERSEA